jgi:hypothetical protein
MFAVGHDVQSLPAKWGTTVYFNARANWESAPQSLCRNILKNVAFFGTSCYDFMPILELHRVASAKAIPPHLNDEARNPNTPTSPEEHIDWLTRLEWQADKVKRNIPSLLRHTMEPNVVAYEILIIGAP